MYEVKFKGEGKTQQVVQDNLPPQMVADFWTAQTDAALEKELTSNELGMCSKTKSTQHEKKKFHTAGLLVVVADNGIVIKFNELYVSEACSQVYLHLMTLLEMEDCGFMKTLPCAYDDSCHPKAMAMNPKRRDLTASAKMMAKWTAKYMRIDRFHEKNHKDKGAWYASNFRSKDLTLLVSWSQKGSVVSGAGLTGAIQHVKQNAQTPRDSQAPAASSKASRQKSVKRPFNG